MTGSWPKNAMVKLIVLGAAVGSLIAQTPAAKAPAEKPIEGSLTLVGKTYKLVAIADYEMKLFDDKVINVLACDKSKGKMRIHIQCADDRCGSV